MLLQNIYFLFRVFYTDKHYNRKIWDLNVQVEYSSVQK